VRGEIVLADVRLDLDDPPDPAPWLGLSNEVDADQSAGRLERGPREELARQR
jgi:hypothetical protein